MHGFLHSAYVMMDIFFFIEGRSFQRFLLWRYIGFIVGYLADMAKKKKFSKIA